MMKFKTIYLASLLALSQVGQASSQESLDWDGISKNIVNAKYSVSAASDYSCGDLEDIIEELDGTSIAKFYRHHEFQVEVKLLKNVSDNQIHSSSSPGQKIPGRILLGNFRPEFQWDRRALSLKAEQDVADKVEQSFVEKLNDVDFIDQIAKTGSANFSSNLSPMYCDLKKGRLEVAIQFDLFHSDSSIIPSPISMQQIEAVNKSSAAKQKILTQQMDYVSTEDNKALAAVALGAEMQRKQIFGAGLSGKKLMAFLQANIDGYSGNIREMDKSEQQFLEKSLETVIKKEKELTITTGVLEKE